MTVATSDNRNTVENAYIFVELLETPDGALFLASDYTERMYSGLEHLDPGQGVGLLSAAAVSDIAEWSRPYRLIDDYRDPVTRDYTPPGELIAYYERRDRDDVVITVVPSRCGNAGRRLLGLPTPRGSAHANGKQQSTDDQERVPAPWTTLDVIGVELAQLSDRFNKVAYELETWFRRIGDEIAETQRQVDVLKEQRD